LTLLSHATNGLHTVAGALPVRGGADALRVVRVRFVHHRRTDRHLGVTAGGAAHQLHRRHAVGARHVHGRRGCIGLRLRRRRGVKRSPTLHAPRKGCCVHGDVLSSQAERRAGPPARVRRPATPPLPVSTKRCRASTLCAPLSHGEHCRTMCTTRWAGPPAYQPWLLAACAIVFSYVAPTGPMRRRCRGGRGRVGWAHTREAWASDGVTAEGSSEKDLQCTRNPVVRKPPWRPRAVILYRIAINISVGAYVTRKVADYTGRPNSSGEDFSRKKGSRCSRGMVAGAVESSFRTGASYKIVRSRGADHAQHRLVRRATFASPPPGLLEEAHLCNSGFTQMGYSGL
jgi:hypothetical protein